MKSCSMEQDQSDKMILIDRNKLIRDLNKLAPDQFDAVVNAVIMSQPEVILDFKTFDAQLHN